MSNQDKVINNLSNIPSSSVACDNAEQNQNLNASEADSSKILGGCSKKKRGSKQEVFEGLAEKTGGGLCKEDLMVNKKGKIISKKRHEHGLKAFDNIRNYINAKDEPLEEEDDQDQEEVKEIQQESKIENINQEQPKELQANESLGIISEKNPKKTRRQKKKLERLEQ